MIISIDSTIVGALVRKLGGEVRLTEADMWGNPNLEYERTINDDLILRVDK